MLAAVKIQPTTSSEFAMSACSAYHFKASSVISSTYDCSVTGNIITVKIVQPLDAAK
jgi:hypothetical protein